MTARTSLNALAGTALLALGLCVVACPVYAGLTWEKTVETFESSSSQDVYTARYPFTNSGTTPIEIREIKTTCGCTTAQLPKTTYAPGEQDEVVVSFVLRGRRGPQKKLIRVKTSDPGSDAELTLSGTIQEVAVVKPVFLMWRKDSEAGWQTARIEVRQRDPVKITGIEPSNPDFVAEMVSIEAGRSYEIRVRPVNGTATPATGIVKITTDAPGSQPLYVHTRIK